MMVYVAVLVLGVGLVLFYTFSPARIFAGKTGNLSGSELNSVQDLFFRTVFILLGYVAKRDGPVNDKEVKRTEIFMEKMELSSQRKREAIRLFKSGADPAFNALDTLNNFKSLAKKSPNLAQILLIYLINLAKVDGALVNKEVEAVEEVAFGLGYSNLMFKHLLRMISSQNAFTESVAKETNNKAAKGSDNNSSTEYKTKSTKTTDNKKSQQADNEDKSCEEQTRELQDGKGNLKLAYDVLEISPNASNAEVKKAYRSLASQFHPDKLMGQGLPSYMLQASTECFKTIHTAYEYIQKARG